MDSYISSRDPRLVKRPRSDASEFSSNRLVSSPEKHIQTRGDHPPAAKLAPAPFDQASGDVIIRTMDSVDFRVKSAILAEASAYFRAWFSKSAPAKRAATSIGDVDPDGLPIFRVNENAELLNVVLRFCYPVDEPCIKSALALCDVLVVAMRYEMDYVVRKLIRVFKSFAEKEPLKMYMFACRRKWPVGITLAAKASLTRPIQISDLVELENIADNQFISGLELLRLQAYHKACGQAASCVIGFMYSADMTSSQLKLPWLPTGEWAWFTCQHKNALSTAEKVFIQNNAELPAAKWWTIYLRKAQEKLRSRPSGATVLDAKPFAAFAAAAMEHCGLCKRQAIEDLLTFNNLLAHQVEKAVGEVEFDPKPETRLTGSAQATIP
ncbi:hypothetical protein BDY19DRAFT_633700 [Irpex rosettiformis]|uniref:Uncharacterized protein n=1 Tax=Irpex rosettiformis TaxID=378272 RepID=A0ACB8UBD5_9APHY|nr:hypothetical protein BDY19DRAFT_633700 [Irpex rosettiformis]